MLNIKKLYNSTAEVYNKRYAQIQSKKYQLALQNINLDKESTILDLGAGTCLLSKFLNRNIISIDLSFNMLKQSPNKLKIQANAEYLPFKNNTIDFIASFTLFQNIKNKQKALEESKRILKPEKTFILTTLYKEYKPDFLKLLKKYFKVKKIEECDEDIAFTLIKHNHQ
jgi:ubiquinone/menaquinone biosynthesis C-methylase UbiE